MIRIGPAFPLIVSTFEEARSPWLRRNLVQRLHNDAKVPVEHVVIPAATVGAEGVPVE
jgi:hypothetical protein